MHKTIQKRFHRLHCHLARQSSNFSPSEIKKFDRLSANFWDINGPMKMLHRTHLPRMKFIRSHVVDHFGLNSASSTPLKNLSVLDVGSGGGILSESLTRLGASVKGIDLSPEMVKMATAHRDRSADLKSADLVYEQISCENMAKTNQKFDIVCALEIVEHLPDVFAFLQSCDKLLNSDGILFISTINKTLKSLLLAKIAAEYVLRIVPPGTHDWNWFQRIENLEFLLKRIGLTVEKVNGIVPESIWLEKFLLSENNLDLNYILMATKD